jgi:hypothetical protein
MAARPRRAIGTEQLDGDRRVEGVCFRRRPQGDPDVLRPRALTQIVDVRDEALMVGRDGDFDADRSGGSGIREWLVSGSGHDTAFWLKRIREAQRAVAVTGFSPTDRNRIARGVGSQQTGRGSTPDSRTS